MGECEMVLKVGDRLRHLRQEPTFGWTLEVTGPFRRYRGGDGKWVCQWVDTLGESLNYAGAPYCYISDSLDGWERVQFTQPNSDSKKVTP